MNNILVVCVGNICRSPMGHALLQAHYPTKHIDSAGLSAMVGHSADPKAISVMADHHLDITSHRAKQITAELTMTADLILTMSSSQAKWIESQWAFCRGKTFRIGHWLDLDIADPYRHEMDAFVQAYDDIVASLNEWYQRIG